MSEGTEVLNQNETPQNLDRVQQNILGALDAAAQQINAGKAPASQFVGRDTYNILTEVISVKAGGPAAFFVELAGDASRKNQGGSLFLGGGAAGGGKRARQMQGLAGMNSALGLPKTYAEKVQDMKILQRMKTGAAVKSRNPLAPNIPAAKGAAGKPVVTREGLERNASQFGLGHLTQSLGLARHENEHKSVAAVVQGVLNGDARAKEQIDNFKTGDVADRMESAAPAARSQVMKTMGAAKPARSCGPKPPCPGGDGE